MLQNENDEAEVKYAMKVTAMLNGNMLAGAIHAAERPPDVGRNSLERVRCELAAVG